MGVEGGKMKHPRPSQEQQRILDYAMALAGADAMSRGVCELRFVRPSAWTQRLLDGPTIARLMEAMEEKRPSVD